MQSRGESLLLAGDPMGGTTVRHRARAVTIGLVAAPILALYLDDWVRLIPRWWSDPNYTHGFFVPLFSLYFVWEKWDEIKATAAEPSLLGVPVLVLGLAVKLATLFYDSMFISCCSMIVVIAGAVLLILGVPVFRLLAAPVIFLVLMMPLPLPIYERIALPLQKLAAAATTTVLRGCGIPALREGNVVELPQRSLEVVDACSGMRFLSGFIALGVAFAYLSRRPLWERVLLVASTIPIAIFVNILRVTFTAFLSHWGFHSLAEGTPHAGTALVLFALSALFLWGEYYVLSHLFLPVESMSEAEYI